MTQTKHFDFADCKSYKTYENAVKAATKAARGDNHWFVIVAGKDKSEGRFIPVFVGMNSIHLAHMGFPVISK